MELGWQKALFTIALAIVAGHYLCAEDTPVGGREQNSVQTEKRQVFKGRSYEDWSEEFQTELDPELRIKSLKALIAFGANGRANEVVPTLLELFDGYPPELMQVMNPQSGEAIQKYLKGPDLHPDLQFYFQDFHDLTLLHTASIGFHRLALRAIPELVRVLEERTDRATARMAAFLVLMRHRHPVLAELMPKIVAQHQDQLSELVFQLWEDGGDNGLTREQYEASAPGLLELKEKRHVLRAIKAITQSAHPLRPEIAAPMLNKLVQTTTDPIVKVAAIQALTQLQPAPDSKLPSF